MKFYVKDGPYEDSNILYDEKTFKREVKDKILDELDSINNDYYFYINMEEDPDNIFSDIFLVHLYDLLNKTRHYTTIDTFNLSIKFHILNKKDCHDIFNNKSEVKEIYDYYKNIIHNNTRIIYYFNGLVKKEDSKFLKLEFYSFINLIHSLELDCVVNLTKEEMFKQINYDYDSYFLDRRMCNNERGSIFTDIKKCHIYELLGCYVNLNNENYKPFDYVYELLDKYEVPKDKRGNNIIFICKENIDECKDGFDYKYKKSDERKYKSLYDYILEMVLSHEVGHLIFEYTLFDFKNKLPVDLNYYNSDLKKLREKQANYHSSINRMGSFDDLIETLTSLQSDIYKDPVLYTEIFRHLDENIEKVIKLYTHINKYDLRGGYYRW